MELSIICVNWNSVDYLRDCLGSIYENTHDVQFEVIVVDNASPSGDVESLRREFCEVTIVKSAKNLGFSKANNVGFHHSKGNYLLFLNPDTRIIGSAIGRMLACLRSLPNAGIVGCKLLNSDLSVQTESIQRFPRILNQLLDIEYLRLRWPHCRLWEIAPLFTDCDEPIRVEVIPGACMMLKRDVFVKVGLFSEDYFMYAEDIDLNFKVSRESLSSYYVGRAQIVHHGGASSRRQDVSQWATIMKFRSMITYYKKTRGDVYAALYRGTMAAAAGGRLILLGLMLPVAQLVRRRKRIVWAANKWSTVLKCAVGLGRLAPEHQ